MNLNKLLHIATYAGRILLENGAEIYRVEETIVRICNAYGIENTDSFVTPTGIVVSLSDNNETISIVKRIKKREVNLNKIDKVNDLARKIVTENISLDDFYDKLEKIYNEPEYNDKTLMLFAGLSAACYSFILGGHIYDFISAFIIGILIKMISLIFKRLSINEFFINFIGGSITALLALIFYSINHNVNIDKTIIGAIMLLVPGLAITNAVRDIIAGDFLAGLTKAAEAFIVAIAIASGSGIILSFWINTFGGAF